MYAILRLLLSSVIVARCNIILNYRRLLHQLTLSHSLSLIPLQSQGHYCPPHVENPSVGWCQGAPLGNILGNYREVDQPAHGLDLLRRPTQQLGGTLYSNLISLVSGSLCSCTSWAIRYCIPVLTVSNLNHLFPLHTTLLFSWLSTILNLLLCSLRRTDGIM